MTIYVAWLPGHILQIFDRQEAADRYAWDWNERQRFKPYCYVERLDPGVDGRFRPKYVSMAIDLLTEGSACSR